MNNWIRIGEQIVDAILKGNQSAAKILKRWRLIFKLLKQIKANLSSGSLEDFLIPLYTPKPAGGSAKKDKTQGGRLPHRQRVRTQKAANPQPPEKQLFRSAMLAQSTLCHSKLLWRCPVTCWNPQKQPKMAVTTWPPAGKKKPHLLFRVQPQPQPPVQPLHQDRMEEECLQLEKQLELSYLFCYVADFHR